MSLQSSRAFDLPPFLVTVAMMLLYPSSCPAGFVRRVLDDREDLAGNVAFQAAYDLGLAQPLPGVAAHVLPSAGVVP